MKGQTQKALQGQNMHLAVPSQARCVKFSTKSSLLIYSQQL